MKKHIVMTCAGLFAASAMAVPDDLDRLSKDLTIMETVLNTSLTQAVKETRTKVHDINATYLKDQGVLFRVGTGHGGIFSGGFFDEIGAGLGLDSPDAVREFIYLGKEFDLRDVMDGHDIDVDIDVEEPEQPPLRERLRDLKLERRDIGYEKREVARRKRDVEFELKRADKERQQELESELAKLDKEMERIHAEQQTLQAKAEHVRQEKQKMRQERESKRKAARTRFLSSIEASLVDTFCRYGSGLNALDNDENVNVVIERFGDTKAQGEKRHNDRIYVFSVKDIKACVSGKVKPESLLDKASVYSF